MKEELQTAELFAATGHAGMPIQPCYIVELDALELSGPKGVTHVPAGPAIALHATVEMLRGAELQHGVHLSAGKLTSENSALALLFIRSGTALTVAVLDMSDTEVRRCMVDGLATGYVRIALSGESRNLLTCVPLPGEQFQGFLNARAAEPVDWQVLGAALRWTTAALDNPHELKAWGIELPLSEVGRKALAVHMSARLTEELLAELPAGNGRMH